MSDDVGLRCLRCGTPFATPQRKGAPPLCPRCEALAPGGSPGPHPAWSDPNRLDAIVAGSTGGKKEGRR